MKQTNSFLLLALAVIMGFSMAACSDNDEPDLKGKISTDDIRALSRDGSVATYVMKDFAIYDRHEQNGWKWEDVTETLCGVWPSLPQKLIFQDGKLWRELPLFFSYGPHMLYDPWYAYKKVTGCGLTLYTCPRFVYDENAKTLSVGATYDVIDFTSKKLTLSRISQYQGGVTGNGGEHLMIYSYEIGDPVLIDSEKAKGFDSTKEAYRYILDCARGQFGRYIDMNEILAPNVILDDPIIDLDMIEKALINSGEI